MPLCELTIKVAARSSPLSQIQVEEVFQEFKKYYPNVVFEIHLFKTTGDLDLQTSLRTMPQNNFFTKEIDEAIMNRFCDIGIHSAKDLPSPMSSKIVLAAVTQGIDSRDSLVLRDGDSISTLPSGSKIGTSSFRRIETISSLRKDLSCVDIRGNIGERLEKLYKNEIDGLVVAEAALIRLGLTHLNREFLPGETVEGQGKLAVTTREDNVFIIDLFRCLDSRI